MKTHSSTALPYEFVEPWCQHSPRGACYLVLLGLRMFRPSAQSHFVVQNIRYLKVRKCVSTEAVPTRMKHFDVTKKVRKFSHAADPNDDMLLRGIAHRRGAPGGSRH